MAFLTRQKSLMKPGLFGGALLRPRIALASAAAKIAFEPRIILLRIVALAIMVRVRAGNNICISFGRPLAITMDVRRENANQHYGDYENAHRLTSSSSAAPSEDRVGYVLQYFNHEKWRKQVG